MYFYMYAFVNICDFERCATTVVYSLMSCRINTKWTSTAPVCVTLCSAQPSPSTPSVFLFSSEETEEMQKTQNIPYGPTAACCVLQRKGQLQSWKGEHIGQSWAWGRRSKLSLLCGDKARGEVSILKCGYCSGTLLSMARRGEKGDEHVSSAPSHTECSTLCCCSCKYCDLEAPSEGFSDKWHSTLIL